MASFKIHTTALKNECETMSEEAQTLSKYVEEIDQIAAQISLDRSTASVKKTLKTISKDVRTESANLVLFSSKLNEVVVQYETAEKNITKESIAQNTTDDKSGDEGTAGSGDETQSEDNETNEMIWTILGFIPGLNCAADIRQIWKDFQKILDGDKPTVGEIMGILMDFAFLAMDFIALASLAKNIAKGIKAAKVASTAAKEATKKAAKAAKTATKAASKTGGTVAKTKAAQKAVKTAKKAENTAKKAEAAKEAAKAAKKEAAKNAVKETAKKTAENVVDKYAPTERNHGIPNKIPEDARDQMIG